MLSVRLGLGLHYAAEIRILFELTKGTPDKDRIRLEMRNVKASDGEAIFQIAVIFAMANLTIAP